METPSGPERVVPTITSVTWNLSSCRWLIPPRGAVYHRPVRIPVVPAANVRGTDRKLWQPTGLYCERVTEVTHWQEGGRKPRIVINAAPVWWQNISARPAGLEEEGSRSTLHRPEDLAVSLAWRQPTFPLHRDRAGQGQPSTRRLQRGHLFFVPQVSLMKARPRLGTNAARLVKGIPFRTKDEEPSYLEGDSLSAIVATVIKVLQEYGVWKGGSSGHAQKGPGID